MRDSLIASRSSTDANQSFWPVLCAASVSARSSARMARCDFQHVAGYSAARTPVADSGTGELLVNSRQATSPNTTVWRRLVLGLLVLVVSVGVQPLSPRMVGAQGAGWEC